MPRKIKQYTNPFLKAKGLLVAQGSSPLPTLQSAFALHQQGQLDQAANIYQQLLEIDPRNADSLHLLGVIAYQTGNHKSAVDMINHAIQINPHVAIYYFNFGNALQKLKQFDSAVTSYDKATALKPDFSEAYSNRGNAQQELKQFDSAVTSYDKAIELKPDFPEAYSNRGNAQQELKQFDSAVASYDKAIELKPDYAKAYSNRGIALKELKQFDAALSSYNKAIAINPDFVEAYSNRGIALQELKQFDAAIASYDKAIELKPDYDYLLGRRLYLKMHMCDWQEFESTVSDLSTKIQSNAKASPCFPLLALPIGLADLRKSAEIWNIDKNPPMSSLGPIIKRSKQLKIRIGYYSADFHNHATANLMAELFERHDKAKFELIAFSYGPDTKDEMQVRICQAFDQFINVTTMSDKAIAQLSRKLGIDIAIDLKGLTTDTRLGIFSYKAAPIQVSYLGYPGTLGVDYIDYLIADKTLIPTNSQQHYSEKIVYLPNSYQVNDRQKVIAPTQFTKQELGLPQEAFVFCCFNNNYKITPVVFNTWVRILKAVDASVLWLLEDNPSSAKNLQKEAVLRGLDLTRLVFAKRMDLTEHLARHKVADLFLDTLPYNAHTTASDALWAGLPVLTCVGESFASRVAASLLNAIELPELVTETQTEYEALAIELATSPTKLKEIKEKLRRNRFTTPLFDTTLFTSHIEAAYKNMYEQYQADLPANHIYIT
jgi:predicted O-linked N-acetylglucosamine transferase (SPINDLY family)